MENTNIDEFVYIKSCINDIENQISDIQFSIKVQVIALAVELALAVFEVIKGNNVWAISLVIVAFLNVKSASDEIDKKYKLKDIKRVLERQCIKIMKETLIDHLEV